MTDFSPLAGLSEFGKLSDNIETVVFSAEGVTRIRSILCVENAGSTPTLTISIYDTNNSIAYFKRKAVAMTAGTEVIFNEPFFLPNGWQIRMQSSDAAGKVDWCLTYDAPGTARQR